MTVLKRIEKSKQKQFLKLFIALSPLPKHIWVYPLIGTLLNVFLLNYITALVTKSLWRELFHLHQNRLL